jgi:prolyl oligopeptidase
MRSASVIKRPAYPPAPRSDTLTNYHGTLVADPYRWLEHQSALRTRRWAAAQQELTSTFLAAHPDRAWIAERLTELWAFPKRSAPWRVGTRTFFWGMDIAGGDIQNQPVLYAQDAPDAAPFVVIDPILLGDPTAAITSHAVSPDGALVAYALSYGGSDWQEIRIRRVAGGVDYCDVLQGCKFVSIAWNHDGTGFAYNRLFESPLPGAGGLRLQTRIYWHTLGTPQAADVLLEGCPSEPGLHTMPIATEDGAYLLLHGWRGDSAHDSIFCRPAGANGPFTRLFAGQAAQYQFIDNYGSLGYFLTDLLDPRGSIVEVDLHRPERWRVIVAAQDDGIAAAALTYQHLLVVSHRDAHHRAAIYTLAGAPAGEIALPAPCSVTGLAGRVGDPVLFLSLESFLQPPAIYQYDLGQLECQPSLPIREATRRNAKDRTTFGHLCAAWPKGHLGFADNNMTSEPYGVPATICLELDACIHQPALDFRFDDYTITQVFYTADDGVRIPMFLTHRRGIALDGDHPVLLYGYGGFGLSMAPVFWLSKLLWLERGGIFALANIRGGGEYGEGWHRAGMLDQKQRSFDDFIAAAEWLIARGYTSQEQLAIMGASHGGLLVAACLVQRPELFRAAICEYPLADMLRYHHFTVGENWAYEFGTADADPAQFQTLYAYSPVHNVQPGVAHPATLVLSGEHDDRVMPMHALKLVAALQGADAGAGPILLRYDAHAGHGLGKPAARLIDEWRDIYAFLFEVMGMA